MNDTFNPSAAPVFMETTGSKVEQVFFNLVETAEDKDLTITNLRAAIQAQHDGFTLYQNTQMAKYAQLEGETLRLQDKVHSLNADLIHLNMQPVATQPIDQIVSEYVISLVSSLLEGNNVRSLIEQAVDQQVERILSSADYTYNHVKEAVDACLDNYEVDCEEIVQTAIEKSLDEVEIKFGRRY